MCKRLGFCIFAIAMATSLGFGRAIDVPVGLKDDSNASRERSSKVDALFATLLKPDGPGASIMVIEEGVVLHKKGYGLSNVTTKTPITSDTIFDLASVSKQFTAMAIMILAEAGQLSYEDKITRFFPEFPACAREISVRNLLNHTSGLVDYMTLFSERLKPGERPSSSDTLKLLSDQDKLEFEPGSKFQYSNSGYVLLAMIVERASGEAFPDFVKENIFEPLGMDRSVVFDETDPKLENRAKSYEQTFAGYRNIDEHPLNLIYGDGAVNTNLEDMYKWDQALHTEKLVSASALKEAFCPSTLTDGNQVPYGFGWNVKKVADLDCVGHGGGWVGFRTYILRFLSRKLSVVVLSNLASFDPEKAATAVAEIYVGTLRNSLSSQTISP